MGGAKVKIRYPVISPDERAGAGPRVFEVKEVAGRYQLGNSTWLSRGGWSGEQRRVASYWYWSLPCSEEDNQGAQDDQGDQGDQIE